MGATQHYVKDRQTGSYRYESMGDSQVLLPWYAALANRHNAPAVVGWMGDSYPEGYPVTTYGNTLQGMLLQLLTSRFPIAGAPASAARGFVGVPTQALITGPPAGGWYGYTFTGGSNDDTHGYGAKFSARLMLTGTQKAVLAVPNALTAFDIMHIIGTSGGASDAYYKIGAGAAVPFSTVGASTQVQLLHVASAVSAGSTIEIGRNANNGAILCGVQELDAGNTSSGFRVHALGAGGATSGTWTATASATGGWPQAIASLGLHLLVIQLGGNDFLHASPSSATFKTNMQTVISMLRAAGVTCPIVLAMTLNATPLTGGGETLQKYTDQARAIAANDATVTVVEFAPRAPAAFEAATYGLYHTDGIHGNANGVLYSMLASVVASAISPMAA